MRPCGRVAESGHTTRRSTFSRRSIGDDLGGIAVHIGARIAGLAGEGEVLISRTVVEAVTGSGLLFEYRGAHSLEGVPEKWEIHVATTPGDSPADAGVDVRSGGNVAVDRT